MCKYKKDLFEMLYMRSFNCGKEFILSSGEKSNVYFDCRRVTMSSEGAYLIGKIIYKMTKNLTSIGLVGGMESAAIPIITATVLEYYRQGLPLEGFYVKKERKHHGTKRQVEGILDQNWQTLIVDDVVTTGNSIGKVIEAVLDIGGKIAGIISLIDRGTEKFTGYNYQSIFTMEDFTKHVS
jgi:orotate phosphoribosyltransferase